MSARPVHVCVQGHGRILLACPTAEAPAASCPPSVPATHGAGIRDGDSRRTAHAAVRQNGSRSAFPAASLLEAVVASVVLLIVFAASLETVVRLTAGPSDGIVCAEADYRAACTASEIRRGAFSEGKTERSYGWGTLTVLIEPYASCPALWQATLTVKIAGGRKRMEYRYLVGPDGFDRNTIIGNE